MITCLKTNISTHFIKHLFKYINCLFKEQKSKLIKQEQNKEKRKVKVGLMDYEKVEILEGVGVNDELIKSIQ